MRGGVIVGAGCCAALGGGIRLTVRLVVLIFFLNPDAPRAAVARHFRPGRRVLGQAAAGVQGGEDNPQRAQVQGRGHDRGERNNYVHELKRKAAGDVPFCSGHVVLFFPGASFPASRPHPIPPTPLFPPRSRRSPRSKSTTRRASASACSWRRVIGESLGSDRGGGWGVSRVTFPPFFTPPFSRSFSPSPLFLRPALRLFCCCYSRAPALAGVVRLQGPRVHGLREGDVTERSAAT